MTIFMVHCKHLVFPIFRCHNLAYLSVCFCEHISEAGIELLGQTHSLTSLDISGCNCGDVVSKMVLHVVTRIIFYFPYTQQICTHNQFFQKYFGLLSINTYSNGHDITYTRSYDLQV